MTAEHIVFRPQPGPQEQFLASPADIVIYGGAAFGGKTFALLLEGARFSDEPAFGGVIFRRESTQITAEGGLWDTSEQIYPHLGAEGFGRNEWRFPSGAKLAFRHLQHEKTKFAYQGAQLPLIGFDELTHFSESVFWYMLSRNRDPSGTVRPYVRATTNPDPDSWVADLIGWWIDQDTGYAIPERSGVIRYMVRVNDSVAWADTAEELERQYPGSMPLSLTFIASSWADNPLGLKADPGYMARLSNLPKVEAERLKSGNWKIRPAAGDYFRDSELHRIHAPQLPARRIRVRWWDRAASEPSESYPDPDWTVGVLMSLDLDSGNVYIEHIERLRGRPGKVQATMRRCAEQDGRQTTVGFFRDPAAAGIAEAEYLTKMLVGYRVAVVAESANKETKAGPLSSYATGAGDGHGHVYLVEGPWVGAFVAEAENFPKGRHDDQVDAASGAFNWLSEQLGAHAYAYHPVDPIGAGRRPGDHLRSRRAEEMAQALQPRTGGLRRMLAGRRGGL